MLDVSVVRLQAIPKAGSDAASEFGGAMINVWLALLPREDPTLRARQEVDGSGWHVVDVEAVTFIERQQIEDPSDLELFEQCLVDKIVMVFHVWPLSAGGASH